MNGTASTAPGRRRTSRRFCLFWPVEDTSSSGGKPVSKIQHAWGQAQVRGKRGEDMGKALKKIPWSSPTMVLVYLAQYLSF